VRFDHFLAGAPDDVVIDIGEEGLSDDALVVARQMALIADQCIVEVAKVFDVVADVDLARLLVDFDHSAFANY